MSDFLTLSLTTFGNLLGLIVFPIIIVFSLVRLWKEFKQDNEINFIRFILLLAFIGVYLLNIFELIYDNTPAQQFFIDNLIWVESITTISLRLIIIGFIVTIGLTIITYANQWRVLLLFPWFYYSGLIFLYLTTGVNFYFPLYVLISGPLGIIFLFFTGFRLKDSGSFGLAILFALQFSTIIITIVIISEIINIISFIFVLIFGLGYFKPFKEDKIMED